MQALAKNFLCVADEVWLLDHLDTPGAKFFREYVKRVPPQLGFGSTTKQGVYVMTPDGDFLGGHFARHGKSETLALLKESLGRWNEIVREKGLKPKPIPVVPTNHTWGAEGLPYSAGGKDGPKGALILQVYSRDMPGPVEKPAAGGVYQNAWNENWIDFTAQEMAGFLPKAGPKGEVPEPLFRRMARACLIDNVRGQTAQWEEAQIRKASLTSEVVSAKDGLTTVRLHGEFAAEAGPRGYSGTLHGRAVFDTKAGRFKTFELVATGIRKGGTSANFRGNDPPSTIGHAFVIEGQYDKPAAPADGTPPEPERKGVATPKASSP